MYISHVIKCITTIHNIIHVMYEFYMFNIQLSLVFLEYKF